MVSGDLAKPEQFQLLEQAQARTIEREIRAAVQKAQAWGTDIFEFGEAIHRKYPMVWADLEKRWAEEFPYVELRIEVDAKLRRIGLSTKQIDPFFALNFDPLGWASAYGRSPTLRPR